MAVILQHMKGELNLHVQSCYNSKYQLKQRRQQLRTANVFAPW